MLGKFVIVIFTYFPAGEEDQGCEILARAAGQIMNPLPGVFEAQRPVRRDLS